MIIKTFPVFASMERGNNEVSITAKQIQVFILTL